MLSDQSALCCALIFTSFQIVHAATDGRARGLGGFSPPPPPHFSEKIDLIREESLQSPHFKSLVNPPTPPPPPNPNLKKCSAIPGCLVPLFLNSPFPSHLCSFIPLVSTPVLSDVLSYSTSSITIQLIVYKVDSNGHWLGNCVPPNN